MHPAPGGAAIESDGWAKQQQYLGHAMLQSSSTMICILGS